MAKLEAGTVYRFAAGTVTNAQLTDTSLDIDSLIPHSDDTSETVSLTPDGLPLTFTMEVKLTPAQVRWFKMLFYRNCIDAIYQRYADEWKSEN